MSYVDETSHFINEIKQIRIILEGFENHIFTKPKLESDDTKKLLEVFQVLMNTMDKVVPELEQSELRYKEIYENSPVLYRTINLNGIIVNCNKKYAERLGCKKSEIMGTSVFDPVDDEMKPQMKKIFDMWKKKGYVSNEEIWLKTRYGTQFPVLLNANNLYDVKGKIIGSNTVLQEISDIHLAKKAAEEKIRLDARIKELEKLDKLREELLSTVKHEFKTPLVPIKGYCEMLLEQTNENLTAKQRQSLIVIFENVKKFDEVIDKILDIHSLEADQLFFKDEIILVQDFMEGLADDISKKTTQSGIKFFNSSFDKAEIKSDVLKIRDVLNHLIENAMDFTPQNNGKIEIGTTEENKAVTFFVKNNGPHIPKSELQNIFKKLYQVDTSYTRRHQGMGLGLAICKLIVEKLGGNIWCESEKGKGTAFYFTIPTYNKKITVEQ